MQYMMLALSAVAIGLIVMLGSAWAKINIAEKELTKAWEVLNAFETNPNLRTKRPKGLAELVERVRGLVEHIAPSLHRYMEHRD